MEINVGDRFVRDSQLGTLSYTVTYVDSLTVHYVWDGNKDKTMRKLRRKFIRIVKEFNVRRITPEQINVKSHITRHKFK